MPHVPVEAPKRALYYHVGAFRDREAARKRRSDARSRNLQPCAHARRPLRRRACATSTPRRWRRRSSPPSWSERRSTRRSSTTASSATAIRTARRRRWAASPSLHAGLPVEVARLPARPALRLRPAGDLPRRHGGADGRRGRGARRRRREHEPGRVLRERHPLGPQPRQPAAARPPRQGTRHRRHRIATRSTAGCSRRRRTCASSTTSRARSRTSTPCARTSGPCAAWDAGRFDAETVPVSVPQKKGDPVLFARDEHPRADTTLEKLASLRPIRLKTTPSRRSRRATPAARTTPPPAASSPTRRRRRSWA